MTPGADHPDAWPRRRFLRATGALLATPFAARLARPLTAAATTKPAVPARTSGAPAPTGAGTTVGLRPAPATVDLGGTLVDTWAYDGTVPGPLVRVTAGRPLTAVIDNGLPTETTVHWHGIVLPFDMDGVPGVSQEPIAPGASFTYRFTPEIPGTYFFHPHVGVQLDRGLYAPLIVEDPAEPGRYDTEWVVVLDDWTDGVGPSPDEILIALTRMGPGGSGGSGTSMPGMTGMTMPGMTKSTAGGGSGRGFRRSTGTSALLGGPAGDVAYPLYLANGRVAASPAALRTPPGARVRLRLVNAAAETAFRVALGGHRLTLTHADGYAVAPVTVDSVLLGMGERVDATFTAGDGVFPLVALAEGKGGAARALLRTSSGRAPRAEVRPDELDGRVATVAALRPTAASRMAPKRPDGTFRVALAGNHHPYRWTINGRTYGDDSPIVVDIGQRVRLDFVNRSPMFHPMHLHGHTFAVLDGAGHPGARKDTVIVKPGARVRVDFEADNSGDWMLHCHNAYHQDAGMMTSVYYSGA